MITSAGAAFQLILQPVSIQIGYVLKLRFKLQAGLLMYWLGTSSV